MISRLRAPGGIRLSVFDSRLHYPSAIAHSFLLLSFCIELGALYNSGRFLTKFTLLWRYFSSEAGARGLV